MVSQFEPLGDRGQRLPRRRLAAIGGPQRLECTTRFEYDLAGRLVETIHPDATTSNPDDNPRTSTEYDAVGRKIAEVDELGRRELYAYAALGRLVPVTLPNSAAGLIDGGEMVTRYIRRRSTLSWRGA